MRSVWRRRCVDRQAFVLIGACLLLLLAGGTCFSAGDPDIKEIARRLDQWRSSFVTIRAVWESRNPEEVKAYAAKFAAEGPVENVFIRTDWTWTDYGESRLENWNIAHGRIWYHDLWGCDGRRLESFSVLFAHDSPHAQNPRQLNLRRMRSAKPSSSLLVMPLTDVYFEGEVRWLGEKLAAGEGKLEGYEKKDEVRCARVKLSTCADCPDESLWLDPNESFLPRRISGPNWKGTSGVEFAVNQFQRLDSGIPFPKRGTYYLLCNPPGHVDHWVVTRVEVNKAYNDALFQAPRPVEGTLVADARAGRAYRFRTKSSPAAVEGQMARAAKANAPTAPRVSAALPTSRGLWWCVALLLASVLLLCTCVWFRIRGKALVLMGVSILLLSDTANLSAADRDIKEIARRLNQWRSSFVTLRIAWERRNADQPKAHLATSAAGDALESVSSRQDWIWADYGVSRMETWNIDHGRVWSHDLWGCDGRRLESFSAVFACDSPRPQDPKVVGLRRMRSAKPSSCLGVLPLTHLYFEGSVRWLGEMLAAGEGKLEGFEKKDGARCARVKLSLSTPGYPDEILWLDPSEDFLVRHVSAPKGKWSCGFEFIVEEFQRLDSGIPFPKCGIDQVGGRPRDAQRWVVTRVEVNKAWDDGLFQAPRPVDGTLVQDGRAGLAYRVGGKSDPGAVEAQMVRAAKANAPTEPRVAAVVPVSRALWWSAALLIGSLALLCVGIWTRLRH